MVFSFLYDSKVLLLSFVLHFTYFNFDNYKQYCAQEMRSQRWQTSWAAIFSTETKQGREICSIILIINIRNNSSCRIVTYKILAFFLSLGILHIIISESELQLFTKEYLINQLKTRKARDKQEICLCCSNLPLCISYQIRHSRNTPFYYSINSVL